MSWPANNLTRIHCTGDSITSLLTGALGNYPGAPGGLIDQSRATPLGFNASPTSQLIVPSRPGQAAPAAYSPLPQCGRRQVFTVYGVGGRTMSGLQGDLPASVYCWAPDILIIELGTNDFGIGTNVTPGGAFQVSTNAVLDGVHATLPSCKILILSITCRSEVVVAGPHFTDATDTWAGNTRIQESVAARSSYCEYVDVIGPALAYSAINNPIGSSSTPRYLTQDSLHPTPLGKVLLGTAVAAHIAWS